MGLTLDWLHLVTLLGAVQGVFLAAALATKRRNRTANRVLAVLMLAFSIGLATNVYHAAGLVPKYPHLFGLGYPLPLLYGPLVYLYAVHAADRDRSLRGRDMLHLLPFVALVIAGLPIYMMSGPEKAAFYESLQAGMRPPLLAIADPLKLVSGVSYAGATLVFLHRHKERVKASYSTVEQVNLRWLLWFGSAAAVIWVMAVAFEFLESTRIIGRPSDDIISLAVAVLVYAVGYRGLKQPEIFRYETAEYAIPAQPRHSAVAGSSPAPANEAVADTVRAATSEPEPGAAASEGPEGRRVLALVGDAPRYERSGLSEGQAERLKDALLAIMDREEPWRDSELTLADLAARLKTTPHKLSEVLNAQIGESFYDFVNGYRVREVQRRIAAGDATRVKMLALAMDAGFASKSTFNLVFKKHTSQTPSDYRERAAG